MDRRHFLATGTLAATAAVVSPSMVSATAAPKSAPFTLVQFYSDGLGLNPREYAMKLSEAVAAPEFAGDNYSLGGSLTALEAKFAKLLNKPAAMYVPTGTLANHLAIRKLTGNDRRVLLQAESHFFNDSGDCGQTLSGLTLIPLAAGATTFTLDEVQSWIKRTEGGRVAREIGVISIESPVRRTDHAMFDFEEMRRISEWGRGQGIRLHLDGARLFNLPLHSGHAISDYTALFDTVYVSLWKHFNTGAGAMLAGESSFIEGLFHERRMFGGALPRAWPETAVATHYVDGYLDDYASAWAAAEAVIERLTASNRFKIERVPKGTSKFFLRPLESNPDFLERAQAAGIGLAPPDPITGMIGMQVNPSILRRSPTDIAKALIGALSV